MKLLSGLIDFETLNTSPLNDEIDCVSGKMKADACIRHGVRSRSNVIQGYKFKGNDVKKAEEWIKAQGFTQYKMKGGSKKPAKKKPSKAKKNS